MISFDLLYFIFNGWDFNKEIFEVKLLLDFFWIVLGFYLPMQNSEKITSKRSSE